MTDIDQGSVYYELQEKNEKRGITETSCSLSQIAPQEAATVFCKEDKTIKRNVVGDMSETHSPELWAPTTEQMECH